MRELISKINELCSAMDRCYRRASVAELEGVSVELRPATRKHALCINISDLSFRTVVSSAGALLSYHTRFVKWRQEHHDYIDHPFRRFWAGVAVVTYLSLPTYQHTRICQLIGNLAMHTNVEISVSPEPIVTMRVFFTKVNPDAGQPFFVNATSVALSKFDAPFGA
jgi:hypothetical protein